MRKTTPQKRGFGISCVIFTFAAMFSLTGAAAAEVTASKFNWQIAA